MNFLKCVIKIVAIVGSCRISRNHLVNAVFVIHIQATPRMCFPSALCKIFAHLSLLLIFRSDPVGLAYNTFQNTEVPEPGPPLIIIHGLFGSKRSWGSLAKVFAKSGRKVW